MYVKMAEGGGSEEDGLSIVTTGSEFVFDFYCEFCRDDCKHIDASGFCVECGEYLCEACLNAHRRSRQTRYHKLLGKSEMPMDTPLSQNRVSKDITTICRVHSGEVVKFYCKPHDVFGCSTCFVTGHRDCSGIESILEKSESVVEGGEFQTLVQNLNSIQQKSRDMIEHVRENISNTERCCSEAVSAVRELRQHINTVLDGIEQHFITHAEAIASEEVHNMESLARECSDISEKIESISSEVDHLQTSRRVCQLFIKMKETATEIKSLQENLTEAEERLIAKRFKFEPSNELKDLLTNKEAFGKLSVQDQDDASESSAVDFRGVNNKSAKYVSDIDVGTDNDAKRDYHLVGSAVVSSSRLIIVDHYNYKVKLFDTQSKQILTELTCRSFPFDIAVLNKDQIAVSLFNSKTILLVRMNDKMTVEREVQVGGNCRGVAYSQDKLLVTFDDNPRLEILDLYGNVDKTIQNDTGGNELFLRPRHVCVSKDNNNIYVSDDSRNLVVNLSFDGIVKSVYNGVKGPQKICIDHHGNVYVCGYHDSSVHVLSSDFTMFKVLLTKADGVDSPVLSVSHCPETNRLFVGMKQRNVKVFQLT